LLSVTCAAQLCFSTLSYKMQDFEKKKKKKKDFEFFFETY